MGSTGSGGSVLAVVNLDVLDHGLGLNSGGLGRGSGMVPRQRMPRTTTTSSPVTDSLCLRRQ